MRREPMRFGSRGVVNLGKFHRTDTGCFAVLQLALTERRFNRCGLLDGFCHIQARRMCSENQPIFRRNEQSHLYGTAPNWSAADGVVTLYPPTGPEVEVRLDSPDNRARSCAIALLKNEKNELTVTREVRYIHGTQSEISKAYRWGLKWTAGRK